MHLHQTKDPCHILVIDDDTRIRELLAQFLKEEGFLVSTAQHALDARKQIEKFVFDLLIIDVTMPGEDGVSLTRDISSRLNVPVLMLTAMGEVEHRIQGLEAGASDYLPKPFEPRELLLRIHSIIKRQLPQVHIEHVQFGAFQFHLHSGSLTREGQYIMLTEKEAQLLELLARHAGKTLSREDLAKACGGVNERSIDVQITRLRNKIEEDPKKPRYLKTMRGSGYSLYVKNM